MYASVICLFASTVSIFSDDIGRLGMEYMVLLCDAGASLRRYVRYRIGALRKTRCGGICGKPGHNARTCKEAVELSDSSISTVIIIYS
jgi:hypothetical protein